MEEKEKIFEGIVDTDIFDADIDVKVAKKVKEAKLKFDKDLLYRLEIVFDLKAYEDTTRLRSFVIKNDKALERIKDDKDIIGEMLSQQLKAIEDALSFVDISSSLIKGDEINNLNIITIQIAKDKPKKYNKKGELIKEIKEVVVLKDLEPLSFMLINKEYVGMKIISKKDAKNFKKLDICWK